MTRALRHTKAGAFAPAQCPFPRYSGHSSRDQYKGKSVKVSCANFIPDQEKRRKWFSALMWRAFPGASIREKALRAAPVLDLSPKQCENLLKMEHDAKLPTILAVLAIAGAESIFDIVDEQPNGKT